MAKMTPEIMEAIEKQNPVPIATASADGTQNVIYVGYLKAIDEETVLIADNFLNKSRANLEENPKISFVAFDGESNRCYPIKGNAEIFTSGKVYDDMMEWVNEAKPQLPKKAAVLMHVEEVFDSMPGPNAGSKII